MRDADVALPVTGVEIAAPHRMLSSGEGVLDRARLWPLRVVLEVPIVAFTVRTLMDLHPGVILETAAPYNEDVVLQVNGQVLGTAKFDVTGQTLAVRMTGVA